MLKNISRLRPMFTTWTVVALVLSFWDAWLIQSGKVDGAEAWFVGLIIILLLTVAADWKLAPSKVVANGK